MFKETMYLMIILVSVIILGFFIFTFSGFTDHPLISILISLSFLILGGLFIRNIDNISKKKKEKKK